MIVSDDEHSSLVKNELDNSQRPTTGDSSLVKNELDNSQRPTTGDCKKNNRRKVFTHRKSYSKELKKHAIVLRDGGLTIEAVAKILDTSRSNVEKWCSSKVT